MIFGQLLLNGAMLAGSILSIDLFLSQWSPQLFYGIYGCLLAICNTFLFCYLASKTSHSLRMMSAHIYACNWYKMENSRQKDTILMIMFAQLERNLDGLGIIRCDLETFAQVDFQSIFFFSHFNVLMFGFSGVENRCLVLSDNEKPLDARSIEAMGVFRHHFLLSAKWKCA